MIPGQFDFPETRRRIFTTKEILEIIKDIVDFAKSENYGIEEKLTILYPMKEDHAMVGTNVNIMISEYINRLISTLEESRNLENNNENNNEN